MSKRIAVLTALRDRLSLALDPLDISVLGLDGKEAAPSAPRSAGELVIASGDPGDPEVDLSPLRYHYAHTIPLALILFATDGTIDEIDFAPVLLIIAATIDADPTIGGLCDWCELTAPTTDPVTAEKGQVIGRSAEFDLIASYSTPNPLH